MNDRTDGPTPSERQGSPDCLVEMAMAWMQRPLGGLSQGERGSAITEMCLVISQMRHREARLMDDERLRWIQRIALRLCQQSGVLGGDVRVVEVELSRRMLEQLLRYHEWREQIAPVVVRSIATGPSEGGEVSA